MSQFFKAKSDFAHPENTGFYSSDYLTKKKNKLTTCNLKKSMFCNKKMTQHNYLVLKQSYLLSQTKGYDIIHKNNLLQNTFYLKDLDKIPVLGEIGKQTGVTSETIQLTTPTNISYCLVPFYAYYEIDPTGVLFGNSCDVITEYE